jgi:hypothetical protein
MTQLELDNRETLRRRFTDDAEFEHFARLAVRNALLDHKRTGDPIVVWRDGKVVWIPADEIVVSDE